MTSEQLKAKELIDKFRPFFDNQISKSSEHAYIKSIKIYNDNVKQCAILCVDEEIKTLQGLKEKLQSMNLLDSTFEVMYLIDAKQTVKQEIINYKS